MPSTRCLLKWTTHSNRSTSFIKCHVWSRRLFGNLWQADVFESSNWSHIGKRWLAVTKHNWRSKEGMIHWDLSRKLLVQVGEESTGLFYQILLPIPRGDHILSPLIVKTPAPSPSRCCSKSTMTITGCHGYILLSWMLQLQPIILVKIENHWVAGHLRLVQISRFRMIVSTNTSLDLWKQADYARIAPQQYSLPTTKRQKSFDGDRKWHPENLLIHLKCRQQVLRSVIMFGKTMIWQKKISESRAYKGKRRQW